MVSAKFVVAFLAVLGAAQSAPQPRVVDIALVVENVVAIVQNIVVAVDGGIVASDPNLDIINAQFPPAVGEALEGLRADLLGIVRDVEARVVVIIDEVRAAIVELDKISKCTDAINADAEAVLDKLFLAILATIRTAETNNADGLANVKAGVQRIVGNARVLFDTSLSGLVTCLKPGAKEARTCVDGVLTNLESGVVSIAADALLFVSEVIDVVSPFVQEIIAGIGPSVNDSITAGGPLLQSVSDCVATLPAGL